MAGLKWSPGCGCCDPPPAQETCTNEQYVLTSGTSLNSGFWSAANPSNVSYVAYDTVDVTNTTLTPAFVYTRTAYYITFEFQTTTGTITVNNADLSFAIGSASSGEATATLNGGTARAYTNDANNALYKYAHVAYTPTHTRGQAVATGNPSGFGTNFLLSAIIVDDSTTDADYDENWEIEVTGTVRIKNVWFRTATVAYDSTPSATYCNPSWFNGTDQVDYQFYKAMTNTPDITDSGFLREDALGNRLYWNADFSENTTSNSFILNTYAFRGYKVGSEEIRGTATYLRDTPSEGNEYPIPYYQVTFAFDITAACGDEVSDTVTQNVNSTTGAFSMYLEQTENQNQAGTACDQTSGVTWNFPT